MYNDEEKILKSIENYSAKSKDELLDELKQAKKENGSVATDDFEAFKNAILPMLDEEQIKRLDELKKVLVEK